MTQPVATIVVPLLDRNDAWLEQSVLSAAGQGDVEVIVVVSHAAPSSNLRVLGAIARRFGNLQVMPQPADRVGALINAGIDASQAPRVGLLMPGDWLAPTAVAQALAVAADIVGTGTAFYAADGVTRFDELTRVPTAAELDAQSTAEAKAGYLSPFLLFDRGKLRTVGGVDESIGPGAADHNLAWRLLERGATAGVVEQPLYNVRDPARGQGTWLADTQMTLAKHGVGAR